MRYRVLNFTKSVRASVRMGLNLNAAIGNGKSMIKWMNL